MHETTTRGKPWYSASETFIKIITEERIIYVWRTGRIEVEPNE